MHNSVYRYFEQVLAGPEFYRHVPRVLEVGSLDVNGSLRPLFPECQHYVGIDRQDGPGVDVVGDLAGYVLTFPRAGFDVVVCTEVFEHDLRFWRTMELIGAVLRPGGVLLWSGRGMRDSGSGMPRHDYPGDHWRIVGPEAVALLFDLAGCEPRDITEDPDMPGYMGWGVRR